VNTRILPRRCGMHCCPIRLKKRSGHCQKSLPMMNATQLPSAVLSLARGSVPTSW
jgi:hypothetical protein